MSHTNSTTNYSLPQFLSTDKPAWLTDVNGAMSAIDTAIKNAADAASTAGTDASQALLDAGAASTAASAADAKASGSIASLAQAFDSTATYSVGALVVYNSLLYICSTAVTTPGAWTGSTNWTRTNFAQINTDNMNSITAQLNNKAPISSLPYITTDSTHTTVPTGANITIVRQRLGIVESIKVCQFRIKATAYNSGTGKVLVVPAAFKALVVCDLVGIRMADGVGVPMYIQDDSIFLNGPTMQANDEILITGFYI